MTCHSRLLLFVTPLFIGAAYGIGVADAGGPDAEAMPAQRRASDKVIALGRRVYQTNCAACHGDSGRGDGREGRDLDPTPTDLSQRDIAHKTDAELFRAITRGRRPMPSFRKLLGEEDRWQVVAYLRTFSKPVQGDRR